MGQANVRRWVDDILPLLTDEDPLGVESFATHRMPLADAPHAYDIFRRKRDGACKIVFTP
jgi:threonine dehydrogenase-like Zn-dependent dehydrogenase